eukprot:UN11194
MLSPDHCPSPYVKGEDIDFLGQHLNWYLVNVQELTFMNPPCSLMEDFFFLALIIYLAFGKKIAMVMNTGSMRSPKWIRSMHFLKMLRCTNNRKIYILLQSNDI